MQIKKNRGKADWQKRQTLRQSMVFLHSWEHGENEKGSIEQKQNTLPDCGYSFTYLIGLDFYCDFSPFTYDRWNGSGLCKVM